MKRNLIIVAAVAVLWTSCGSEYVVTDSVSRNLAGTRTILSKDTTSLENTQCNAWEHQPLPAPQAVDFRVLTDTMRYSYSVPMERDGWTIADDSLTRLLRPQVTVNKSFRWFTTRYRYTARFPKLDNLTVPVTEYLTPDQAQLLFGQNEWPSDWNGADLYGLLDKLNTKYVRWWSHCFFERQYELYMARADSAQRTLLANRHDTLLALVLADLDDDTQATLASKAELFPELDFVSDYNNSLEVQTAMTEWMEYYSFETHVLWNVELPGGRSIEHKVSADRLLLDDYVIDEHSDVPNYWAYALTLLLLAGGILYTCLRSRRTSPLP